MLGYMRMRTARLAVILALAGSACVTAGGSGRGAPPAPGRRAPPHRARPAGARPAPQVTAPVPGRPLPAPAALVPFGTSGAPGTWYPAGRPVRGIRVVYETTLVPPGGTAPAGIARRD